MNNIYDIQPVSIGIGLNTETCSKVRLDAGYAPFATEMAFSYAFINGSGNIVYTGYDRLGASVLTGWGTDDQYIINAMASQLGITLV